MDRVQDKPVISLRFEPQEWEDARERSRRGGFVCPRCREVVRLRVDAEGPPRFVHSVRSRCPLSRVSGLRLAMRAVLYGWLRGICGARVELEHEVPDLGLPGPADCWVSREGLPGLGWWIFDCEEHSRERRAALRQAFAVLDTSWRVLFPARLLQRDPWAPDVVHLSPTEREFTEPSPFDTLYLRRRRACGSLHYLDAEAETLTTVRSIQRIDVPRTRAHAIESPLADAKLRFAGDIVHPGELAARRAYVAEVERLLVMHQARSAAGIDSRLDLADIDTRKVDAALQVERPPPERGARRNPDAKGGPLPTVRGRPRPTRTRRPRRHRPGQEPGSRAPERGPASDARCGPARRPAESVQPPSRESAESSPPTAGADAPRPDRKSRPPEPPSTPTAGPDDLLTPRPDVPCSLCGRSTPQVDQFVFDGATGTCKCRRCMGS